MSVANGVSFHGDQAVIPTSLQIQVRQLAHEGHPGIVKMRQRQRDCVWWPVINKEVEQHVNHCQACLLSDKSARRDATFALDSVPTKAVAHRDSRHQKRATWQSFALALPYRCLQHPLQLARSALRQHRHFKRRDQLSRGTLLEMGSADKDHH